MTAFHLLVTRRPRRIAGQALSPRFPAFGLAVLLSGAVAAPSAARAAVEPATATVMIRVIGDVTAPAGMDDQVWRPAIELEDVALSTGSGFIFAPGGYVLTSSRVIRGGLVRLRLEGRPATVTIAVHRVQVVLVATADAGPQTLEATVIVDDPGLDLAILRIGAMDLPHLPLGDGNILVKGERVAAWGFPFGEDAILDTAPASGPGRSPSSFGRANGSSGTITAVQPDGATDVPSTVPYLQTSIAPDPGHSGGPLVDGDGYVVGVVRGRRDAKGIGYAVSIEAVKDLIERNGLDAVLTVTRLSLGPVFDFRNKGLRMRTPAGFADVSPLMVGVRSGTSLGQVSLTVDRVASHWDVAAIEQAVLEGAAFGMPASMPVADRPPNWHPERRVRTGLARLDGEDGATWILFAILDLGGETVIARYVAPADEIAFNRATLHESLASIEAERLIAAPLARPLDASVVAMPVSVAAALEHVPADTVVAEVTSAGCPGLQPPAGSIVALLARDFRIRFSATWWSRGVQAASVARACLGDETSRATRQSADYFGVTYRSDTRLVESTSGQVVVLSIAAPGPQAPLALPAFTAWIEAARNVERP